MVAPALWLILLWLPQDSARLSPGHHFEKAVFYEHTTGDLARALVHYERVVNHPKAAPALKAKALYQMGHCNLKSGNTQAAVTLFIQLLKAYPDQKTLVARANPHGPPAARVGILEKPMWPDGELLVYRVTHRQSGKFQGVFLLAAQKIKLDDGEPGWRLNEHWWFGICPGHAVVEVRERDFRPIRSRYESILFGSVAAEMKADGLEITSGGTSRAGTTRLPLNKPVYLFGQARYFVRTLPMYAGFKETFPFYIEALGLVFDLDIAFADEEKITVPAGEFVCRRAETPQLLTYWISSDSMRYPVRAEYMGMRLDLEKIGRFSPGQPSEYRDSRRPYSLTLPRGWFAYEYAEEGRDYVYLLSELPGVTGIMETTAAGTKQSPIAPGQPPPPNAAGNLPFGLAGIKPTRVRMETLDLQVEAAGLQTAFRFRFPSDRKAQLTPIFKTIAAGIKSVK